MTVSISANDIQGLYIAYFNRPADYLGLQFWTAAATNAGNLQAVADAFAGSPEYTATFAGKSTVQIIDQVYMNLFGRHAEPDGLKFWGNLLDNKVLGLGNIAYQIMQGAQDTVGGDQDKTAVASKIAAATAFYNALDTSAEIVAYSGDAANAAARAWLSTVTGTASLDTATSEAGLAAITGAIVQGSLPVPTPHTFTLTTGADAAAIVGGAGIDTFNALPINAAGDVASTLTNFDAIDGGAGVDVLNIYTDIVAGEDGHSYNGSLPTFATVKNVETVNILNGGDTAGAFGDASKFVGVTTLNQVGKAINVTKLSATTVAGFKGVEQALSVAGTSTAATVSVALDGAGDGSTLAVSGKALAGVTVAGTVVDGADVGSTVAAIALHATAGDAVTALTLNTAVAVTLTVTDGADAKVSTVNAGASTGKIAYDAAATVANITTGAAKDNVTLNTVFTSKLKAATVTTGAGDDTVTIKADNSNDIAASVTVSAGEGNDKIFVQVTQGGENTLAVNVDAGAGDDIVHVQTEGGDYRALTDNDNLNGGAGKDTIVVGSAGTLDSGDYIRLQDLKGFEALTFANGITAIDASLLSQFTTIGVTETTAITKVAAEQALVVDAGTVTVTTVGYDATLTGGKDNDAAAAANVSVISGSDLVVNAKSLNLTVDTTAAEGNVETSVAGHVDNVVATLVSTNDATADVAATEDYSASLVINPSNTFESLVVKGTGTVTLHNESSTTLKTIDTSALKGTTFDGDAFAGLNFFGNIALKESVTVGAGIDTITIASKAGDASLAKMDTITGLTLKLNASEDGFADGSDIFDFNVTSISDTAAFVVKKFIAAPASLGAALNTVSAMSDDAVVFAFGGNTYLFVEDSKAHDGITHTINGNFEATDFVVKLTGAYDVDVVAALGTSVLVANLANA